MYVSSSNNNIGMLKLVPLIPFQDPFSVAVGLLFLHKYIFVPKIFDIYFTCLPPAMVYQLYIDTLELLFTKRIFDLSNFLFLSVSLLSTGPFDTNHNIQAQLFPCLNEKKFSTRFLWTNILAVKTSKRLKTFIKFNY